jgi:predicted ATP-dependent endonuclease of OLD family
MASIFSEMTKSNIQIIYTSHSPFFVDLHEFDNVRIIRKEKISGQKAKQTRIVKFGDDEAIKILEKVWSKRAGSFSKAYFSTKLSDCMNVLSNEGFFADVVVLVEGLGDIGILWQMQKIMKKDWMAKGITIIPAMGKTKLDKPIIIFKGFNIPVYFIFDGDKTKKAAPECNKALLRLAGSNPIDFPSTNINSNWACFEEEIETEMEKTLGVEYNTIVNEVTKELGVESASILKNIESSARFIELVYLKGNTIPFLEAIVNNITAMKL